MAEFDTDPEAVNALVVGAREGRFDHVAQRLCDDRREATARTHLAAGLREQGVRVIDKPTGEDPTRELDRLTDAEGARLTADTQQDCEGHAAYLGQEHGWRLGRRRQGRRIPRGSTL